jgi:hypothetical protein
LPLAAFTFSISLWFFYNLIIAAVPADQSEDSPYRIVHAFTGTFGNTLSWWVVAIAGVFTAVGLNLGVTGLQRVFFPTDKNLWQEIEKQGGVAGVGGRYDTEQGWRPTSTVSEDSPSDLPLDSKVAFVQKQRNL